jgi:hypothetical protein
MTAGWQIGQGRALINHQIVINNRRVLHFLGYWVGTGWIGVGKNENIVFHIILSGSRHFALPMGGGMGWIGSGGSG